MWYNCHTHFRMVLADFFVLYAYIEVGASPGDRTIRRKWRVAMRHDEQYQLNRIFMRSSEWRWTNMRIIGTSVEFSYGVFWNGVYGDGRNKMGKFADAKLRHEQSRKIGIRKKRKKNNGQVQLGSHRKRERETRKKSKDAVRNARNSNEKSFLQMHS